MSAVREVPPRHDELPNGPLARSIDGPDEPSRGTMTVRVKRRLRSTTFARGPPMLGSSWLSKLHSRGFPHRLSPLESWQAPPLPQPEATVEPLQNHSIQRCCWNPPLRQENPLDWEK